MNPDTTTIPSAESTVITLERPEPTPNPDAPTAPPTVIVSLYSGQFEAAT